MSKAVKVIGKFGFLGILPFVVKALTKKPKIKAGNGTNEIQPRPPRKFGAGVFRASGSLALRRSEKSVFVQIPCFPEGPVSHYGRAWLNQDEVKPLGNWFQQLDDGRYETGRAKYYERFGKEGQGAYAELLGGPWGWSTQHYGAGIPSNLLILEHGKQEDATKQFPAGPGTELTREAFYLAYDWRKDSTAGGVGPQRRYAKNATAAEIDAATATWEVTTNPVVWWVNTEWRRFKKDWDRYFAPVLDGLTLDANWCDDPVLQRNGAAQVAGTANPGNNVTLTRVTGLQIGSPLNVAGVTYSVTNLVGNTVYVSPPIATKIPIFAPARWINATPVYGPRYEVGLQWDADEPLKQIRDWFRGVMDGHLTTNRRGAYVIRAGRYYDPTVIFGRQEIIDWDFDPGPQIGEAPNVYTLSFKDPITGYVDTDTDAWRNETNITATGGEVVDDFAPEGVRSDSQLKRLAKASMDREHAPRLTVRTPLSARRGLGERYIGVRIKDEAALHDAVLEISEPPRLSLTQPASIIWTGRLVTPARYAWNATTEEGNGPVAGYVGAAEALETPDITSIDVFFEDSGSGPAPRLRIVGTGPDRGDLTWFYRRRTTGDTSWLELPGTDSDPSPDFTLLTDAVPSVSSMDIQVAYRTGGGTISLYGPIIPAIADTTTESVAPSPPTLGAASSPGGGQIQVTGRNSTSINFDHVRIWRGGAASSFGSATSQGTVAGAPGGSFTFDQAGVTAGAYRIWVTAENSANTPSTPIGPFAVTVS